MADWTGKELGDYRLDAALEPDRYGARYRATAGTTGATVEVRVIAPPAADDRWFADRVASALRRYDGVSAPDLAPLLAVGTAEGAVYTVGPLLAAATLRARLGAPLPLAEVVALLTPIARALDALHARYLPHGGLRPEAIILDPAGPLLRDAGVAPALAAAARLAAPAASAPPLAELLYRAPEAGSGSVDPRADIFSLAAVAYEALTGRAPFTAADAGGAAERLAAPHRDSPPPSPREVNPALSPATEAALRRGLAKYPFERPDRASVFLDLLREGTAGAAAGSATAPFGAPVPTSVPPPAAWLQATPPPPSASTTAPAYATPAAVVQATPLPPVAAVAPPAPAIVPAVPPLVATPLAPPVVAPPLAPEPYAYRSPEPDLGNILARPAAMDDLMTGRAALVTTLAALVNRRTLALAVERQQTIGTLRAIETTRTARQRPADANSQADARATETRRPSPAERAARYAARQEWRKSFAVPTEEAVVITFRSTFPFVMVALVVSMFGGSAIFAFLFLLGGILFGLYRVRDATRYSLIGKPDGFVIEDTLLPWQPRGRFYRWSDVTALRYAEQVIGKGESARAIGTFTIETNGHVAATFSDRYPGLDLHGLIELFGREARRPSYRWVLNDTEVQPGSGQRPERFRKVGRGELGPGDAA